MQTPGEYHYDFSYSLAFQDLTVLLQTAEDSEKQFLQWNDIFLKVQPIHDPDFAKIAILYCRLPLCRKIGLQLLQICHLKLDLIKTQEDKEILIQTNRQKLYELLQEMNNLFGQEKKTHLPYICLIYYFIIFKILENKLSEEQEKNFIIFHCIYWELKGQLATKQLMKSLIGQKFNAEKCLMYTDNTKIQLIKYHQNTQRTKREAPFTFRDSMGGKSSMHSLLSSRNLVGFRASLRENIPENLWTLKKIGSNEKKTTPIKNQNNSFARLQNLKQQKVMPNSFKKIINRDSNNKTIRSPTKLLPASSLKPKYF